MKLVRKYLILSHRYLGIAISLLIVMWFVSGIVMIYAGGMPRLSPELRLERLPAIDLAQVRLTPSEAAERAGIQAPSGPGKRAGKGGAPGRVVLTSALDRPAYRFAGRQNTTVFADTGEVMDEIGLEQSKAVATRFMNVPAGQVRHVGTLNEVDQWTLGQSRQMPLHKFAVDDGSGTELYIQPVTGEVAMLTTQRTRALAWMGVIPHWMYFTWLRTNQPVWFQIVVWTSALACAAALLGLILGFTQFRWRKPVRPATSIPYAGWMRWHYVTGAVFGVFTLTWAFSGLLSMEPFAWTRATGLEVRRDVFTGGQVDLSQFGSINGAAWSRILDGRAVKEMEFVRIQDEHFYVVRNAAAEPAAEKRRERLHQEYNVTGRAEQNRLLVSAKTLEVRREPFSAESLVARLKTALPNVPIVEQQLLSEYDSYYYSRGQLTPLPVLRVKFNDPAQTWFYIDPEMSQMLAQIHRLNRAERWLYSGLHNLDFSFWYNRRPLWDIGMIVLLLGGLLSSGIGLCYGVKRLRRGVARTSKSRTGAAPEPDEHRVTAGVN